MTWEHLGSLDRGGELGEVAELKREGFETLATTAASGSSVDSPAPRGPRSDTSRRSSRRTASCERSPTDADCCEVVDGDLHVRLAPDLGGLQDGAPPRRSLASSRRAGPLPRRGARTGQTLAEGHRVKFRKTHAVAHHVGGPDQDYTTPGDRAACSREILLVIPGLRGDLCTFEGDAARTNGRGDGGS